MTKNTRTLAFEIGTEEIPAFDLDAATRQLEKIASEALKKQGIRYEEIETLSSPRRLIILAKGLAQETEELYEEYRGPSLKVAFDENGKPTKALEGFARGKGLKIEELEQRSNGENSYMYAIVHNPARPVIDLLPQALFDIAHAISWPKSMRWNETGLMFSRPIRWILALFGKEKIPFSFAGIESGSTTRGHRVLAPGSHEVGEADNLKKVLAESFVIASQKKREEIIRDGISAIEARTGTKASLPEKTLLEVVNLTEYPTALLGTFEEEFLEVPEEVIIDAMLVHQRYFPLYDGDGRLCNRFIAVSNGDPACSDAIVSGNERVIRPRLADAKFFYEEDLNKTMESFVEGLDDVVFQESLGTMKEKTERIVKLADYLAEKASCDEVEAADVHRAAYLCKADLVSSTVIEFTSVQGIMGSYYAKAGGENEVVAQAIAEHYRPRFSGDDVPSSRVGILVALADKIDSICGLFAAGQIPTGSSDPFALRRSSIGIIAMLRQAPELKLSELLSTSLRTFEKLDFEFDEVFSEIESFFVTRYKVILREEGFEADAIEAVLAAGIKEPVEILHRVEALTQARKTMPEAMDNLAIAYARANNLRNPHLGSDVDTSLLLDIEKNLMEEIEQAEMRSERYIGENNFDAALQSLASLREPIDLFFKEVRIMDEDEAIRNNRLKILNNFVFVFSHIADFGKLAKLK